MATQTRGLAPTHPGRQLKEIILPALAEAGTPRTQVANLLGIGRQTLYNLVDERRPVTPEMALRLGKLLGNSPEFWLNLQAAYDLHQARTAIAGELAQIPTLETTKAA